MLNFDIAHILENYGWYILFGTIVFLYVYSKLVQILAPVIDKYRRWKSEKEYSSRYHKDPDSFVSNVSGQLAHSEKLQEKYNQLLEEHKMKIQEREERRREEILRNMTGSGHRLGGESSSPKGSKSFKPEYNPLMGSGSSSSYRPPKKSCCGGGGCGKK